MVVGRFGGDPAVDVVSGRSAAKRVLLGGEARWGAKLLPSSELTVASKAPARELRFGLGIPARGKSVLYSVFARLESGAWVEIFAEAVAVGKSGWLDRRVVLEGPWAGRSEFRFQVGRANDTEKGAVDAHVGSIRVIGNVASEQPEQPNVILISLDTLGAQYLGFYGNEAPVSPKLDAWFKEAFTFRRVYAPYGNTLVSHSSLFSGQYPIEHRRIEGTFPLPRLDSLIGAFGAAGYSTAAITEDGYVSSQFGFDVGFDSYDNGPNKLLRRMNPGERPRAERTFNRAMAWLEKNQDGPPFLLFVHTYEVHTPYDISSPAGRILANTLTPGDTRNLGSRTGQMVESFNLGESQLDSRDIARLSALYQGRIRTLDDYVSAFLDKLSAAGLDDDTIVVITADHGEQFGEYGKLGHGASLHGTVLQVPLAIRWPDHIEARRSADDVELIDVMPSLMELAGIPRPDDLAGRSFASAILGTGDGTIGDSPSFSELRRLDPECAKDKGDGNCRSLSVAVRYQGWKLMRSNGGSELRLVHLDDDPAELIDLAEVQPERVRQLSRFVDDYISGGGVDVGAMPQDEFEDKLDDEVAERLRALGYLK